MSIEYKWISSRDSLPDPDTPVLVSDGKFVWIDELQEDFEYDTTVVWWDNFGDIYDTAWIPLPDAWDGSM